MKRRAIGLVVGAALACTRPPAPAVAPVAVSPGFVEVVRTPCLLVSLDGQRVVTDGVAVEQTALVPSGSPAPGVTTELSRTTPLQRRPIPATRGC